MTWSRPMWSGKILMARHLLSQLYIQVLIGIAIGALIGLVLPDVCPPSFTQNTPGSKSSTATWATLPASSCWKALCTGSSRYQSRSSTDTNETTNVCCEGYPVTP